MKNLLLVIAAALILSGCTLFPSASTPITGTEEQKAEKLAQIIARGGQADCQITNLTDNTSTQIIVSGKKMKVVGSDFGEGKTGTMINDTVYSYIWTEGEKTGIKTKLEPEEAITPSEENGEIEENAVDSKVSTYEDETKYKMDCSQRSVSDSEFTPPADVVFTDLSEMMKGLPVNQ
ncbi:MAG: hypothetical protein UW68_C0008G0023 [Candidatus Collierbacteria bacterium GW2011_GWB1_44_6]|uniref:Lipoprotein n=2 Tax=Candidatus Collieribacteriota TaxID=1752725 RepID=A0A0G1MN94_9BACT|nr:MAG: hypothetical protein UV68_C0001G0058 [Candidatus Collierbacteria bacterium GW2011_GWC2_43_12]KKT73494.1 MAG: hypothetical protein UW68_C0008G0023 [Candidatus Collierbacteria bacterium GW2011_GWB1_44_6]KKT83874.1 MAG: hypothetical protein UW80_C0005G0022 [Microgenomates group bacterium GW2011_GWC1_44_9]